MINDKIPSNYGNAKIISENVLPSSQLAMLKYENTFDFFSEEPTSISVKVSEKGEEEIFICILRIRIWNRKKKSFSWSIYSKDRSDLKSVIIRKVIWDMDKDMDNIRKYALPEKKVILMSWPSIINDNKYLSKQESVNLVQKIRELDMMIENGFILHENNEITWEWRDLELLRLYDWGQIHFTWSQNRKNEKVEKNIKDLILEIDSNIQKNYKNIYSLELNFSISPEKYKEIYIDV